MTIGVETKKVEKQICIVRVTTSAWLDGKGIHVKKDLNFLKRRCKGFNTLADEVGNSGALEVIDRVLNLDSITDGIYEVVVANIERDWETGYIEDWDYTLASLEEEK